MTDSVAVKIRSKVRAPKYLLAIPAIIWYLVFFAAPIGFIVVYSFGTKDTSKLLPVDLSNLSSASYSSVFDETFFKVFRATLRISVIATAMCLFIGLPVAYFAAFKVAEKWKAIILAAVVVPSFTSFLIRTVAWRIPLAPNGVFSKWLVETGFIGSNGIQILETATAVQIAIVYNYLGFMILPLFVALDRIDVRMREASKDLGAGRIATFFGVTLPLAGPRDHRWCVADFYSDVWRLCHGNCFRWRQRKHDWLDDCFTVQWRAELATWFSNGDFDDRRSSDVADHWRGDRLARAPVGENLGACGATNSPQDCTSDQQHKFETKKYKLA